MSKLKNKKIIWIVLSILILGFILTPIVQAHLNYQVNKVSAQTFITFDANGYIQNQNATDVFQYGFNTSDRSGCGWIAVYDVLNFYYNLGHFESLAKIEDVIKPLDCFGTFGFGYLGTNPLIMKLFLESKGLDVSIHLNQDEFYEKAKESEINIMIYVGKKLDFGHYQMMKYNLEQDNFTFFNPDETMMMDDYLTSIQNSYYILLTIHS